MGLGGSCGFGLCFGLGCSVGRCFVFRDYCIGFWEVLCVLVLGGSVFCNFCCISF